MRVPEYRDFFVCTLLEPAAYNNDEQRGRRRPAVPAPEPAAFIINRGRGRSAPAGSHVGGRRRPFPRFLL
ncbi:MAG: hypothetical protein BLM47_08970 [Candidatus Reconcilbacillus cellulovorans]|uniref:Uncharacterized protein n=1 Tax=Candidatus Reconcilbacillus cellulovorans TaxID=1906605 RepID=A0A2A6DZ94_9BACL|nr:MAG: hypothetical protein BLM47_08970 [Candidatus Reconcilbacillus cellulovorans]